MEESSKSQAVSDPQLGHPQEGKTHESSSHHDGHPSPSGGAKRLWRLVFGKSKSVEDPHVFHKLSLAAFLAWVGLGADGLSSSAYGPQEAYIELGEHRYLAVGLAIAIALTVFVISYAYTRVIEHFPSGGGGYVVATSLLGEKAGVISGSALIVDYVLTITTSVVAGVAALFSLLPKNLAESWGSMKVPLAAFVIVGLMVLNIRGVKESVKVLVPIFILFLVSHAVLLSYGIFSHLGDVPRVVHDVKTGFNTGLSSLPAFGMLALFFRAYSMGGSSYTGIEAVSNGLMLMREPRVATGRRTMMYMAVSLAVTAGGIILCYMLAGVPNIKDDLRTQNAMLAETLFLSMNLGSIPIGKIITILILVSEAALLTVAAQAGFLDGPRVMSNMAVDSWLPHRFSALSEQLTMTNGVLWMGGAALAVLFYTNGAIDALVVMYSINVFITFTLSQLGMCRFWIQHRQQKPDWKRKLFIHLIGLILCATILCISVKIRFLKGGWMTLVVTGALVAVCYGIRRHYRAVYDKVRSLDELLTVLPSEDRPQNTAPLDREARTAVLLVSSYSGLGVHTLLSVLRQFPGLYKQFIFVSVAVVDSGSFKGAKEVSALREKVQGDLDKYVALTRRIGHPAASMIAVGTDVVEEAENLCVEAAEHHPNLTFFAGKLVFKQEQFWERFLHHQMVYSLQRRLQWQGQNVVILPIRVG